MVINKIATLIPLLLVISPNPALTLLAYSGLLYTYSVVFYLFSQLIGQL